MTKPSPAGRRLRNNRAAALCMKRFCVYNGIGNNVTGDRQFCGTRRTTIHCTLSPATDTGRWKARKGHCHWVDVLGPEFCHGLVVWAQPNLDAVSLVGASRETLMYSRPSDFSTVAGAKQEDGLANTHHPGRRGQAGRTLAPLNASCAVPARASRWLATAHKLKEASKGGKKHAAAVSRAGV